MKRKLKFTKRKTSEIKPSKSYKKMKWQRLNCCKTVSVSERLKIVRLKSTTRCLKHRKSNVRPSGRQEKTKSLFL